MKEKQGKKVEGRAGTGAGMTKKKVKQVLLKDHSGGRSSKLETASLENNFFSYACIPYFVGDSKAKGKIIIFYSCYAMMSIGVLGFVVWSRIVVALFYREVEVINFAVCWNSLNSMSTFYSQNLIGYA